MNNNNNSFYLMALTEASVKRYRCGLCRVFRITSFSFRLTFWILSTSVIMVAVHSENALKYNTTSTNTQSASVHTHKSKHTQTFMHTRTCSVPNSRSVGLSNATEEILCDESTKGGYTRENSTSIQTTIQPKTNLSHTRTKVTPYTFVWLYFKSINK